MEKNTFATVINCIDGRVQTPVIAWVREKCNVDFVDAITHPGDDKTLSHLETSAINSIKEKVLISVRAHGSKNLFIVGHFDCAANPVSKSEHIKEIRNAVIKAENWDLDLNVRGLWVNNKWEVEEI